MIKLLMDYSMNNLKKINASKMDRCLITGFESIKEIHKFKRFQSKTNMVFPTLATLDRKLER